MTFARGARAADGFGELSLRDYVQVLRRHRWLMLGVFATIVAVAVVYSLLSPVTYQSRATVLLRTHQNNSAFPTSGSQDTTFVRAPAGEYAYVTSTAFAREVEPVAGTAAKVTPSYDDTRSSASIESQLLTFTARGDDRYATRDAAQAWADFYLERRAETKVQEIDDTIVSLAAQIDALETEKAEILEPLAPIDELLLTEDDPDVVARLTAQRVTVVQTLDDQLLPVRYQLRTLSDDLGRLEIARTLAERDGISARINTAASTGAKISPRLTRNVGLAVILGLLVSIGAALLRDSLRTRIRSREDVEHLLGSIPVLAELPPLPESGGNEADAQRRGAAYAAEMDRVVSAVAYQTSLRDDVVRVLVTSPQVGEGKSTLVQRMARRLGDSHLATIVLDADLRRPVLHQRFDVPARGNGLAALLHTGESLDGHLRPVAQAPRVRLLPAGRPTDDAASMLRRSFDDALNSIRQAHDVMIVDSPPVLAVNDAEIMANSVDHILVVARAGRTTTNELERTLERLRASKAQVLGVVLVGVSGEGREYSYGYSYGPQPTPVAERNATPTTRSAVGDRSGRRAATRGSGTVTRPIERPVSATIAAPASRSQTVRAPQPHQPSLRAPHDAQAVIDARSPSEAVSDLAVVQVATATHADDLGPVAPTWLGATNAGETTLTDPPQTSHEPASHEPESHATPEPELRVEIRPTTPAIDDTRPALAGPTHEQRRTQVRRQWNQRSDPFGFESDLHVLMEQIRDPHTGRIIERQRPRPNPRR